MANTSRKSRRRRIRMIRSIGILAALIVILILLIALAVHIFSGNGRKARKAQTTPAEESVMDASGEETGEDASAVETEAVKTDFVQSNDWRLILVNRDNPVPENYTIETTKLRNNQSVDTRIYPDLQNMFDDMRKAKMKPLITSSYRTREEQQKMMDDKIAEFKAQGKSDEEAAQLAEEWVALPGTSEHELGISIDITSEKDDADAKQAVWDWLKENSYKYGFIQRYPEDKIDITGIANEPWHYRYVGKDSAKRIYEQGVTLEEYLGYVPIGGSDTAAPAEESGAEETSPAGEETTALAA